MAKKIINRQQLKALLSAKRGARFVGITVKTDPSRYKADRGRISKVTTSSVVLNAHYDKKKAKELGVPVEEVEIKDVHWRERVGDSPIMRHKTNGTEYLEVIHLSGSTDYYLDGKLVEKEEVEDLVKKSSGGPVPYRTPKLTSIVAATIDKVDYIVTD